MSWFNFSGSAKTATSRNVVRKARPGLETLEDRCLMSASPNFFKHALGLSATATPPKALIGQLLPAPQNAHDNAAPAPDLSKIGTGQLLNGAADHQAIGSLLPAIQKLHHTAAHIERDLLANPGSDPTGLLVPAVHKVREAASRMRTTLLEAGRDDAGLLLPAVQKVRDAAARAGEELRDLAADIPESRAIIAILVGMVKQVEETAERVEDRLLGEAESGRTPGQINIYLPPSFDAFFASLSAAHGGGAGKVSMRDFGS